MAYWNFGQKKQKSTAELERETKQLRKEIEVLKTRDTLKKELASEKSEAFALKHKNIVALEKGAGEFGASASKSLSKSLKKFLR